MTTSILGAFAVAQPRTGSPAPQAPASSNQGDAGAPASALNPAPSEFADAAVPPVSVDFTTLLSEVAALRSRVTAVSDALFHSRLAVSLETSADHARVTRLSVWLDGGVVWTSPSSLVGRDAVTVYDHAVAPGHHEVALDVDYREEGDAFRSSQRSRFLVDVPADERLVVEMTASNESRMGSFLRDKKGEYDLRIRARQSAERLGR
ncbi:MAG: hypothetical protein M3O50_22385 [Myxococcota bacterium]|nr:hypothetical protein [Myxococcota bacterium]